MWKAARVMCCSSGGKQFGVVVVELKIGRDWRLFMKNIFIYIKGFSLVYWRPNVRNLCLLVI